MRYLKKRRRVIGKDVDLHQEDPMSGVANLFDVGVVFIVGLIGALISAYSLLDFLSPKTEITMVRSNDNGQVEIVTKKGKQIKVEKVTDRNLQGEGTRLGTAYRLKDGKVVYVPENNRER
ncbi:hypothetical protein BIY37_10060 [Candidatus Brocadia sapporoensis]|uniref:DUF2149 domain-containing protein n=1 Tax=Candidatus Brocadia sapporoensis TaxID=392547 RepID=A0A1V6LYF7_9BACT|nr:DUF2149 domain-containing protein [Candidatus Brocadia sapporoensis]MDG6004774.1 DUF2149 domain-containing protein [Candidatus Brocadia sp.]RZV59889.1 MAG: DUF2149 domain-containing protein [Candidatus Brocadia sp. BROELEC01]MBW7897513.1 DUF2149 domain-containing protein [Candidatus Brocadia sapporoensis]OQD45159.1 hypothetical protein BIY37_10060 [Candidatus Brocadia sapporoensis]QQR65612.1 MAG: DUF2149 domain-containing protein [Candidatus Brocadia sp.]